MTILPSEIGHVVRWWLTLSIGGSVVWCAVRLWVTRDRGDS